MANKYLIYWHCLLTDATGHNSIPMPRAIAEMFVERLDVILPDFEHWVEKV